MAIDQESLLQFVVCSSRLGWSAQEIADDLEALGRNPHSAWESQSSEYWMERIRDGITSGVIRETDGRIVYAPEPKDVDGMTQLMLF